MRLFTDQELFNSLKELSVIPEEKLTSIYNECKKSKTQFEDALVTSDLISDLNLGKVIAELTTFPFIDLSKVAISEEILKTIPEVYAQTQNVVVFQKDKSGLHLAMSDPADTQTPQFISKKTGIPVKVYYTTKRSIREALNLYTQNMQEVFAEIIEEKVKEAQGTKKPEPSIIKIVDTIIKYAQRNKSSDIHIEPTDEDSIVRFRIDGVLHDIVKLPTSLHPQVVTRVKVVSKLRTDEHQSAQDGKMSVKLEGEDLDIRVSIVPVTNGEKIVMRLLSERSRQFSLTDLGLSDNDLKKIDDAYNKPHGMILATGPTGSGKTTTLYAILKLLNNRDVNIMTIEDPVEYDIEGVNQIQVNPATNLTFAAGLRSIVRQDPDIILVGEVRDKETADISINAAMTGHLVLSTLHTNDAATSIPRLLDLGVEPYLIASTLNIIIAQRLVRRICIKCRVSKEVNLRGGQVIDNLPREISAKYFGSSETARVYFGKGCESCHDTGYLGREGIYEVMLISDEIRDAIVKRLDASKIQAIAITGGMKTMLENGIEKVKQGITTAEEVLRVTKE